MHVIVAMNAYSLAITLCSSAVFMWLYMIQMSGYSTYTSTDVVFAHFPGTLFYDKLRPR